MEFITCHVTKSDEKSETLRKEGNELYNRRKFIEALINYNASLCFSQRESENLGHAYANRSAVCFELKRYKECIKNIKLARKNNYPQKNFETLKVREEKCNEHLKRQKAKESKWKFFRLSFNPHKNNPQISEVLEMKRSEKYGRHIIPNKDIAVGNILAIESPFCSVLLSQSRHVDVDANNKYQRCSYCLNENLLTLLPCSNCNCAMFCEECFKDAFENFHKYECSVMEELLNSGSVHIALRIFFVALSTFNGSIEDLEKFIQQNDEEKNFSIFDFDSSKRDAQNYLKFLNTLTRSDKKFSTEAHEKILKHHPHLHELYNKHTTFIQNFLLRQCQTNDHYFHGVFGSRVSDDNEMNSIKDLQQPIGSGWFPFHSLINHSCASNVMRIYVEGKVVLVASRFIPKGSQLFDCYNVSFTKNTKVERQARLLNGFGFKCQCEACENNYPTPPPMKDIKLAKKSVEIEKTIFSAKESIKAFNECCQLINENHDKFPSLELVILQKCFAHFLLLKAK